MPKSTYGLRGLPGLNYVSEAERNAFMLNNAEKLKQYSRNPGLQRQAAEVLYNNQQFVKAFGEDAFDKMNDGSQASYDLRNELLTDKVVGDEWNRRYGSFGADWKYNDLSTDGKLKVLESDWLTPDELKKEGHGSTFEDVTKWGSRILMPGRLAIEGLEQIPGGVGDFIKALDPIDEGTKMGKEGIQEYYRRQNEKIIEDIYNKDGEARAKKLEGLVSTVYGSSELMNMSDDEVKKAFIQAITPGLGNLGIPMYAAFYKDGVEGNIESEMKDFSVDEMREILAKKAVYDKYMPAQMSSTLLNNEAQKYIYDHQDALTSLGLFMKDVGIASLSYTADKANGFYNAGLTAMSWMGAEDPTVYVDDQGNVLDPNTRFMKDNKGALFYIGQDGRSHYVHQEQMAMSTLHNLGRNFDGSKISGWKEWLDPQYWTKAEQFGTMDEDLQAQYEKLGASPYKVVYEPGKDSDFWYESFKMSSFALADGLAQLIPFGIGKVGQALGTVGKLGTAGRALGTAMNYAGRYLTAETRFGATAQGLAGAGGIAYAYQRGAFQETLAQNLANAEESLLKRSQQTVSDLYDNDVEYKKDIDAKAELKFRQLKREYLLSQGEGATITADVEEELRNTAKEATLREAIQENFNNRKASKEFADLQNEAFNSAGRAAVTTFWPEALKYGIVNTIGFRKWLYTNPMGTKKPVSEALKGLREVTTSEGKKRIAPEPSKFLTSKDKWKQLGKIAGSQAWGGAWTNGSDDMMVDAAERINEDSYRNYLNAYENGEALADTYGILDGMYSYIMGLGNSLGQETTLNAAGVGGVGSLVSFAPNFANIASIATKKGRQAFRERYFQKPVYETDESGFRSPKLDENGKPVVENIEIGGETGKDKFANFVKRGVFGENWRDKFSFFIQNGVLNTYYGAKQNEQDLQNHADYVNNLLDDNDDFNIIQELMASDMAVDASMGVEEKKTNRFLKALNAVTSLNALANNKKDPASLSSIVQNRKDLIDRLASMDENQDAISEEELRGLVGAYYSANPGVTQNEENNQLAVQNAIQNAKKYKEAEAALNQAEKDIQGIEETNGRVFSPGVRSRLLVNAAFDGHWKERLQSMKDEINDPSNADVVVSGPDLVATYGGKTRAQKALAAFEKQEAEDKELVITMMDSVQAALDAYNDAQKKLKEATNDGARYAAAQELAQRKAEYENVVQKKVFIEDQISTTVERKKALQEALETWDKKDSKVLSADEIMALDPITRARMLNPENRAFYGTRQQKQLNELEKRLNRVPGSLQKILDIATLTRRISQNDDAYNRIIKNPDAAEVQFEEQKESAAKKAYDLITKRNARILASFVEEVTDAIDGRPEVKKSDPQKLAYRTLRKYSPTLLDVIDKENLLPKYSAQVQKAKEWGEVLSDIDAVIRNSGRDSEWQDRVIRNIGKFIEAVDSKEELVSTLEQMIDGTMDENTQAAADIETILQGLSKVGYQRDATVVEKREERRARQAKERADREAAAQKAIEEARAAAAKKAQEEEEKKAAEAAKPKHEIAKDGSDSKSLDISSIEDQDMKAAIPGGTSGESIEDFESGTLSNVIHKPSYFKTIKDQIGEKKSSWKYYTEDEKNTREVPEGSMILSASWQSTVLPSITVAVDSGILGEEHKIPSDTAPSVDGSNKARNSIEKLKELGINSPKELIEFVEQHDGEKIEDLLPSKSDESSAEEQHEETAADVNNVIEDSETVRGKSPTIEEQMSTAGSKEQHIVNNYTDVDDINETTDKLNEDNGDTLTTNPLKEWVINKNRQNAVNKSHDNPKVYDKDLVNDHTLVHMEGNKNDPADRMENYFAWMNAEAIKLQNIIDMELADILRVNPHAKIKFMAVRPERNATNDADMKTHFFLVLDYDNKVNKHITDIHIPENGGVLKSNGKEYLVVGVAGHGKITNKKKLATYNILFSNNPKDGNGYGLVKRGQKEFFDNNPGERFYVPDGLSTEVVPGSLIPGFIVKALEGEEKQYRNVSELLKSKERNPLGLDMQSLSWGIQKGDGLMVIGAPTERAMVLRDPDRNLGSAFVMIPASNGKLVSSYLKPLFFQEMRNGELKNRVMDLLNKVTAPKYADRLEAVNALSQIFYFSDAGDNILIGKDDSSFRNKVTLKRGNVTLSTFVLGSNRQDFIDAFARMNPRINITSSVLQSPVSLQQYDEAGALQTDAARLATAGSSYAIYSVDANGNMIVPSTVENDAPKRPSDSTFTRSDVQVIYDKNYYSYNTATGKYSLNGQSNVVGEPALVKQLEYNRMIQQNGLIAAHTEDVWEYFILDSGEKPEVIKRNTNNYNIRSVSEKQAKALIEKIEKEKADKEREEAAKKEVEKLTEQQKRDLESGDVVPYGNFVIDPETGEMVEAEKAKINEEETDEETSSDAQGSSDNTTSNNAAVSKPAVKGGTQTFENLINGKEHRVEIIRLIKQKWPDAPTKTAELKEFLRNKETDGKKIEVDVIGSSEADIQAWIKTIKDCR